MTQHLKKINLSQSGIVGMSFAFEVEAEKFFNVAWSIIEKRNQKIRSNVKSDKESKKSSKAKKIKEEKNDSSLKKKKFSKNLISAPTNFTHIVHWGPSGKDELNLPTPISSKNSPNLPPRNNMEASKIQRDAPPPPPKNRPLPELPCESPKKSALQARSLPSIPVELPPKLSTKRNVPKRPQMPANLPQSSGANLPPPPPINMMQNNIPSAPALNITRTTTPDKLKPVIKSDPRDALLESIRNFKSNCKILNKVDPPVVATPFQQAPVSADPLRLALEKIQDATRYSSSSEDYEEIDEGDSDEWD
jgi:hypothetical protein